MMQGLARLTASHQTSSVPAAGPRASLGSLVASYRDQYHVHPRRQGHGQRGWSAFVRCEDPGGPRSPCECGCAGSLQMPQVTRSLWASGGQGRGAPPTPPRNRCRKRGAQACSLFTPQLRLPKQPRPASSLPPNNRAPASGGGVGVGKTKHRKPPVGSRTFQNVCACPGVWPSFRRRPVSCMGRIGLALRGLD